MSIIYNKDANMLDIVIGLALTKIKHVGLTRQPIGRNASLKLSELISRLMLAIIPILCANCYYYCGTASSSPIYPTYWPMFDREYLLPVEGVP